MERHNEREKEGFYLTGMALLALIESDVI